MFGKIVFRKDFWKEFCGYFVKLYIIFYLLFERLWIGEKKWVW